MHIVTPLNFITHKKIDVLDFVKNYFLGGLAQESGHYCCSKFHSERNIQYIETCQFCKEVLCIAHIADALNFTKRKKWQVRMTPGPRSS